METAARIGWLARGVLYVLVAAIVSRVPSTGTDEEADKEGAFVTLAQSPFGGWLLGAVVVGLVGFSAWRAWSAIRGTEEKATRRVAWAASAAVYAVLAVLAVGVLRGSSRSGGEEKTLTATVLSWSTGQWIVGAVGLVVLAVAANHLRKGVQERFLREIDDGAVPRRAMPVVRAIGVAGLLGRALVWSLVGWFLMRAAVQRDPNEPVGLDEALRRVAGEAWGPALLVVSSIALLAYGLLCLVTARWPDADVAEGA